MAFNDRYNTDDVLLRSILVGLVDLLNRKVIIEYVIGDDESKMHPIPFYPHMANQERFMQDFYMHYHPDCDTGYAEGNYDSIPRGIIRLSSMNVDSGSLVNKFVRGTYNKQENGRINAYSDYINVIPLSLTYDVKVKTSSLLESMKVTQEFIATFYKAATFQCHYKGFRIPCLVGFAQDYTIERPIEFSYGDDKTMEVSFPIELETYQPVVGDPLSESRNTEMFRGNTMHRGIGNETYQVSGVSGVHARLSVDVDGDLDGSNQGDISGDHTVPPPVDP